MRVFILFLLFIGVIMIMHGVYEQRIEAIQKNKKIEYRFIPRTYLEEQLADGNVSGKMADMFGKESPWFERTVSVSKIDIKTS